MYALNQQKPNYPTFSMATPPERTPDKSTLMHLYYAKAIAQLTGVSPDRNSAQRMHVAPLSYSCIPAPTQINQGYTNYNLYLFGRTIPRDDRPVLGEDGSDIVTAYTTYLANIDLSGQVETQNQAALDAAKADYDKKVAAKTKAEREILAEFKESTDDGNGGHVDPETGEPITFSKWWPGNRPDYDNYKTELKAADRRLEELSREALGGGILDQLDEFRKNLELGKTKDKLVPGFNMGASDTIPSTLVKLIEGNPPVASPAFYLPQFTLGPSFDQDVLNWAGSFAKLHYSPTNREEYLRKCQRTSYSFQKLSRDTWTDFGFTKTIQTSGSSGWIFWSTSSVTAKETDWQDVTVNENDFEGSVEVRMWGFGVYDIGYGQWYTSNPMRTFPKLLSAASANVKEDIREQFRQVVMAYGVEVEITMKQSAIQRIDEARHSAQSSGGSLSILGSIYRSNNSSSRSNSSSFEELHVDTNAGKLTLYAKPGAPICIAAIANYLPG